MNAFEFYIVLGRVLQHFGQLKCYVKSYLEGLDVPDGILAGQIKRVTITVGVECSWLLLRHLCRNPIVTSLHSCCSIIALPMAVAETDVQAE